MTAPLEPIVEFLNRSAPFDQLTHTARVELARRADIEYQRRGTVVRTLGAVAERLYLVRSGALSETDCGTQLVSSYAEGEVVGAEELLTGQPSPTSLTACEDSLLYSWVRADFEQLLSENPALARRFTASVTQRLRQASLDLCKSEPSLGSTAAPVETLLTRPLVAVNAQCPIRQAAQLMSDQRVSALVVTGGTSLGILTDRDLRNRVVASGRNPDDAVACVMTSPTLAIDKRVPAFEALLIMLDREIHHLVVTDAQLPIGVITTTDLIRAHSENPVHIVGEVNKQTTLEGLSRANQRREHLLVSLISSGTRATDVHRILSRICDAVTRRLIRLAEDELKTQGIGPMPEHCWVVFGSLARNELTVGSDQDNGLILHAATGTNSAGAQLLADRVTAGLDLCGYPKCKGEIMASTGRWRQPLETWQHYFRQWIRTPEKEAIMRASIFFDMRAVEGNFELVASLRNTIAAEVAKQPVFLAHLARDAMSRQPPLGLFRQFVVEKGGDHSNTFDLKHRGLIPIVDLARVLALEAGYTGPNTLERLAAAQEHGKLSSSGCSELVSAFEFIALLRLQHQARSLGRGQAPDSFLQPDDLSPADRRHLRDAFKVIRSVQEALHLSHQLGGLGG